MGKYRRLLSNTAILGMGTFASKVLVLFLMPFYTSILSTAEFGTADLIAQTANLLIPLASVGICDGIFRFTLDASDNKKQVLSTGVAVLSAGSAAMLVFALVFRQTGWIDHLFLIALYVIAANFHSAFAGYIRAKGRTVLFAVQGIINTALTIGLNVVFLLVFEWGSTGYVLSVVVADFLMTFFLFFAAKLWKDLSPRAVRSETAKEMLKFSLPYIPTTMMWLITSASDRYIVAAYCGTAENGLYAAAYKLPTMLSLVSGVFVEAWHFSTVKDAKDEERSEFFGEVYGNFMGVMCMGASVLIAAAKIFTSILLADSYFSSWEFVPILAIATAFSTLVSFLGSVYFVEKKSMMSMLTAMVGAVVNVILNFVMIPEHGAMGAAVATMISYMAVFAIRAVDTKYYLRFPLRIPRLLVNTALLLLQAVVMIQGFRYWQWVQLGLLAVLLILNGRSLVKTVFQVLRQFLKKAKKTD